MAELNWKLDEPLRELDEHLDNAYKRVNGLVGFSLGRDRMNLDALSESAKHIADINLYGAGPFFMRLGQSIGTAATYRPKGQFSLKEMAADILNEFYNESTGGFQAAKLRLRSEAEAWLKTQGLAEGKIKAALTTAEECLMPPSRDEMTRAAMPFVKETLTPGTCGIFGGFGGFGVFLALLRHPLMGLIGAVIGAGLVYYFARKRLRGKAFNLLSNLPQVLYGLLRRNFIANLDHYQDIINQAAKDKA